MWLATSPSRWPPSPSATAHTPISGRSTNASSLILRDSPTSLAAADRKPTGVASSVSSSTRISRVALVSTRADTGRQRYCAQVPSSSATNVRRIAAGPSRSGSSARPPTTLRSTTTPAARTSTTSAATAAARRSRASSAVEPIGICQAWVPSANSAAAAGSSTTRGGRVIASSDSPRSTTCSSKLLEIDVFGRQRLDDQTLRPIEEHRRRRDDGDRIDVVGQLGDERQREIPADAIDAGHHQADHRGRAAGPGRADEAPGRARQIDVEPALAQGLVAGRQALPQPGVPRVDERVRRAPAQEIAVAGQLPEQPYFH